MVINKHKKLLVKISGLVVMVVALAGSLVLVRTSKDIRSKAVQETVTPSFVPSQSDGNLTLFVDAKSNHLTFAHGEVTFDPQLIRLAAEPVISSSLPRVLVKTPLDQANLQGRMVVAAGIGPGNPLAPVTGVFEFLRLAFAYKDGVSPSPAKVGLDMTKLKFVDTDITSLPIPAGPIEADVVSGDTIFGDGFENGNTSAWSSEVDGENDLTVTTGAKILGNYGLAALIDNNTAMYVSETRPVSEPRYRARFYFDPNSIPMSSGDTYEIMRGLRGNGYRTFTIELNYSSSSGYRARTKIWNDANSSTTGTNYVMSDAPHYIEIDWQAGAAAGANNGSISFWIDGVLKQTISGVDNDTHRLEEVRLGAISDIDSGTRGTTYFDGFESRRSTYIGP